MEKKYTDEEIVEGLRQEDHTILKYVMKEPELRNTVKAAVIGNIDDDEVISVISKGVIILMKKIDELHLEESWRYYIAGICKRLSLKNYRNNQNRANREEKYAGQYDLSFEIEEEIEKREANQILRDCIIRLSEICRGVLIGQYWEKESAEDQAEKYGMTNQSLRNKRGKCRKKLRELIKTNPKALEVFEERIKRWEHTKK